MSIIGLLRFSDEEYLNDCFSNNYLFFNTIDNFKDNEFGKQFHYRYDKYENVDEILQPKDISKITIDGRDFNLDQNGGPISFVKGGDDYFTHICCFNVMKIEDNSFINGDPVFDNRLFDFGKSFIALPINELQKFLDEVQKKPQDPRIIKLSYGIVEYVDVKKHSGEWGIYKKDINFSYQKEFRILLQSNEKQPIKLEIPNFKLYFSKPCHQEKTINKINNNCAIIS